MARQYFCIYILACNFCREKNCPGLKNFHFNNLLWYQSIYFVYHVFLSVVLDDLIT